MPGRFQATFMIAFSAKKIHGVVATAGTFNAERFIYFLSNIANTLHEKYVIVWDNSKVHVAASVKNFLEKHDMLMISIPAYWPFVNAWEKLILLIKRQVRMIERIGKDISLGTFKQRIDQIKEIELEEWVKESFKETLNLIKE